MAPVHFNYYTIVLFLPLLKTFSLHFLSQKNFSDGGILCASANGVVDKDIATHGSVIIALFFSQEEKLPLNLYV